MPCLVGMLAIVATAAEQHSVRLASAADVCLDAAIDDQSQATCALASKMQYAAYSMRVDLHTHSSASPDGVLSPTQLVEAAVAAGIEKLAITDHREVDGALEAHERYPDHVIVGEEIHCKRGTHIIGLFLTSLVQSGLTVPETVERIRDQGGVVYAPHPFAYAWNSERHASVAIAHADVVEIFNSRAFLPTWNRRAAEAAKVRGLPAAASTDSHFPWELGRAYTEMPSFSDAEGFRLSLATASTVGRKLGNPWLHVGSKIVAEARRFGRRRYVPESVARHSRQARTC